MTIRKATENDIQKVSDLYAEIHTAEEKGLVSTGWQRNIYPTYNTALSAFERGDLFVLEADGVISGAAIINKIQVDVYKNAPWEFEAKEDEVMVLHTLCISPKAFRKGYGKSFVGFYEEYALSNNCPYLRMDTNEKNLNARAMYKKLGYKEIDMVPCTFNGIEGVGLVLLEKRLVIGDR